MKQRIKKKRKFFFFSTRELSEGKIFLFKLKIKGGEITSIQLGSLTIRKLKL